ncbi:hypothetical protein H4R18_005697 [Coemansia javaensis]|uniref:DASH complex subunit DAD1 n=1 Tax=Coemansia javaensis TaxID=2761396 RepID=A0A9W8LEY8_9FUNG|nr:hypothetical protein H4R18_005697 [Coemansia javaensis]
MDRTEALAATAHGGRLQFEREKERLIADINQGMDAINRNLVQLNQNLESAIALGAGFGRTAHLWAEFGAIIGPPTEDGGGSAPADDAPMEDDEHDAPGSDAADGDAADASQPARDADAAEGADDTLAMDEDV